MSEIFRVTRCLKGVFLTSSALGAGMLAAAGAAQAQETETRAGLDVITVTAQKVEENITEVPLSVATISGENLDVLLSGGLDVRSLSGRVPSLRIESSFGRTFPRFYIRGLGNTDFDLNASQPVSFVYDEVVLENPVAKGLPIFDVERVEVLRGPQGTLFGRNTPAGIVKLDSVKPGEEFEAYGNLAYGRFNTVNWEGAVGGPVADGVAIRLSTVYQHRSDWVDNDFTGEENALEGYNDFGYRGQILFTPTDNFSALFNVHGRIYDGTARVFRANIIQPGTNRLVDGFRRDTVFHDGLNKQKVRQIGALARLEYDFGSHALTSITAWDSAETFSRGDIDGGAGAIFLPTGSTPGVIPFDAESADGLPEHDQVTQEIRLASKFDGPFNYQVGFFYFYEDISIDSFNFSSLGGNVQNGYARQEQQTNSWAIFGQVDYDLTERLNLQAGFRYSDESKDFIAERTQSPLAFLGVPDATGLIPVETDDGNFAWNVSATYAATPTTNIYARVATSFRAPSIQGRLLFGDVVTVADTEEIFSVEGGIKTTTPDNRARLNLTGFWYDIDNQQLTAVGGGANFNQLVNADKTRGYGFEFDGQWAPHDNLLLTAGVSYNFTAIRDPGLFIQPCGGGCTVLDPAGPVPGTVSIDGNRLPHAPRWIANGTARHAIPLSDKAELFALTDVAYSSESSFFLYESAEFRDDLFELGVRVGYALKDGSMEFAAFGRNITNNVALEGGIDFNNLTGFVNEPPLWGIEIKKRL